MKLLTKALLKKLPALYSQDGKGDEAVVYAKFFTPDSNWTWYATEFDPESGTFFGLVQGIEDELGYFHLKDLETFRGRFNLPVERDMYFSETTLGEIK
jgi:hypothetical protein